MKQIIKTESITKIYGDFTAVKETSLTVNQGEIYGFLGLNGAGKTTTIRMLLGLIKPSSGKIFLNNQDVSDAPSSLWNQVGYMVETPYSYPTLTVEENLSLICKLRGINKNAIQDIINLLGLNSYKKRMAKNLSLGNKQRLGLAKALIHQPEILILDEPINGLDPAGILEVRNLLISLAKEKGVTIFVSSHILGEIALLASRIGIIHHGSIIDEFNTNELSHRCQKHLEIRTNSTEETFNILKKNNYSKIELYNNVIHVSDEIAIHNPHQIADLIHTHNIKLQELHLAEENLEEYFIRTINEKGTSHA